MNEAIKLKFSCTDLVSEWSLKYFSFANLNAYFLRIHTKLKLLEQQVYIYFK